MQLFSRKPSLESSLNRIYTEAYQSSLQSILLESSFEFAPSLAQWQATLRGITSGMADLDGRMPRSGQEKSLLSSIMDIERQCHERIASLEKQLAGVHTNPYGERIPAPDLGEKLHGLALTVPEQDTQRHSEPMLPTQLERPIPRMPAVEDMPYDMYSRKPQPKPRSEPILASRRKHESAAASQASVQSAAPAPASANASTSSTASTASTASAAGDKSKRKEKEPRSSLDYQVPPVKQNHALLSTLRGRKPMDRPRPHPPAVPRRSTDRSDRDDAVSAAQNIAKRRHERGSSDQFRGFEGVFVDDDRVSPAVSEPSSPLISAPPSPKPAPKSKPARLPRPQIHVEYEKVSTASGRSINRPVIVRNGRRPAGSAHGSSHSSSHSSSHGSTHSSAPGHSAHSRSSPAIVKTRPTAALSPRDSPRALSPASDVSDPSESEPPSPVEDGSWEARKRAVLKSLRGVDPQLAEQILNEIVFHGDDVNWDDIAGLDRAKSSLKEAVVYPFLRPDLFMGLREPVLGMLLFGPPGTGKTMLARAVATESKSTFFSITASSLTSKYMGESEKLVKALFHLAKALAPSIIFIDEIDSILTQRADSGEHEASRRIKNEFLVQWSDLQAAAAGKNNDPNVRRVLVLGATNLPWAIDEAARRRFVRRQYIPLPEAETRRVHLTKLLSHQNHALNEADLTQLVARTEGYSGSDITALAKDAAMGPLRALGDALLTTSPDQVRPIQLADFLDSMRTIKPSVSQVNLKTFEEWAAEYGSSGA